MQPFPPCLGPTRTAPLCSPPKSLPSSENVPHPPHQAQTQFPTQFGRSSTSPPPTSSRISSALPCGSVITRHLLREPMGWYSTSQANPPMTHQPPFALSYFSRPFLRS